MDLHEGYDGPNLYEKGFQLFRLLSFIYEMQSQFLKKTNIYMQYSYLYYNQPFFFPKAIYALIQPLPFICHI